MNVMEFDELITSPARLAILSALIRGESRSFSSLKKETGLADGNLHVQTRKLEKVGYLEIRKEMRGRRSHTRFFLTERGRETLKLHVRKLQSLLALGEGVTLPVLGGARKDDSQVWS